MEGERNEEAHAVGTIICNGNMIFEVYEGDPEANVDEVEACSFEEEEGVIQGIVVNSGLEKGLNEIQDENGETVLVYVDENSGGYADLEPPDAPNQIKYKGRYSCEICLKSFTRNSDLKRHQKKQCSFNSMNRNSCPICESKFGDLKKKKPFVCGICDKPFSHVRDLKRHFLVHVKQQRFVCDKCKETFDTNEALKKHNTLVHGTEKEYSCPVCSKMFRFKCNLTSHLRVHSEDRPFSCETCERSFKSPSELKSHKFIHNNQKPYTCDICQKTFRQSGNLNAHLRVHRQEKPYVCLVCGKAFVESGKLNRHFRIHTMEKPYSCGTCGKAFCDRSNLKAHMKIHQRNNDVMVLMYVEEDTDISNLIQLKEQS